MVPLFYGDMPSSYTPSPISYNVDPQSSSSLCMDILVTRPLNKPHSPLTTIFSKTIRTAYFIVAIEPQPHPLCPLLPLTPRALLIFPYGKSDCPSFRLSFFNVCLLPFTD
nr:MAG TPA: hypothetical protein [Caudoviricetes sp.]